MKRTMHPSPALNDFKNITPEQVEEFRKNGHILIENILNKQEIDIYREAIVKAAKLYNTELREISERDTYGRAFLQIMNLWRVDEKVKQFVMAKRFAKIASDLLGVENVRIYHDQALFKEPGGGPTPWHQDQYYWPIDTHNTITMWMPLIDIYTEMGMLTFASGSHTKGLVLENEISDESQQKFDEYIRRQRFPVVGASAMRPGDATFHYGYTIHNAPGNQSQEMREVMTIIYIADGARITMPRNKWQENDHKTWLMDLPVNGQVTSAMNPLVL